MRASPITLSTEPPNRSTISAISLMQRSTIDRRSSGSVCSDRAVKPERSANTMVAQRRSSPTPGTPWRLGAASVSSASPQAPQKRKPGGFGSPQAGQDRLSGAPQLPQKRWGGSLPPPPLGQRVVSDNPRP